MHVIVPAGSSVTANIGDVNAMKVAEGVTGAGVFTIWTLTFPASVQDRV